ncbi:MAG TPA: hypothetical protein VMF57_12060 [Solirubrobacteraceae bacterium]|nr:hypothetical protein [Solirubrobacteraceae bacterium]
MTARPNAAVLIGAAALACAGCGGAHPPRHAPRSERSKAADALAQAQATHEYPSPPPRPQTATGASSTPIQAIRRFANAYINWTAQTVAPDMRLLAARSVGQARSAMQLAAAGTADDYELQRGGIANHGTVQAVAPLPGRRDQYVVVTLESTTATNTTAYQGLLPAWHVALATVAQQGPGEWVLSGWQPES